MELRQVVYVEAVARLGGFTRAAEHLHVAQPAVSAQVRQLETELGTPLFVRTTRRVALTVAGEAFLVRARRLLTEVEGIRTDIADLAAVVRGDLRIGATSISGGFDLAGSLAEFSRLYPGVRLQMRSGLVAGLLTLLDAADLDLVFAPIHLDLPEVYTSTVLAEEEIVAVLSPRHPLSGLSPLRLEDLCDETFVCLPKGSGLHTILTRAARAAGYEARIPFEASTPAGVRELVAAGLGVALLASSAATAAGPQITVAALHPGPDHPPIGLIRRRDRTLTPAAQACWHLLTTHAELRPAR